MALDLETRLRRVLASAPQNVWQIETLEISHSAMTTTYYLWREPYEGVTNAGGDDMAMRPLNFAVNKAGSEGHLDQKFDIRIDLTDAEDEFREQMDLIPIDTTEKIRIVYREFLSDDLNDPQSTAVLQAESINYTIGAATISAVSPRLNISRTGETYTPKALPMLRSFL